MRYGDQVCLRIVGARAKEPKKSEVRAMERDYATPSKSICPHHAETGSEFDTIFPERNGLLVEAEMMRT